MCTEWGPRLNGKQFHYIFQRSCFFLSCLFCAHSRGFRFPFELWSVRDGWWCAGANSFRTDARSFPGWEFKFERKRRNKIINFIHFPRCFVVFSESRWSYHGATPGKGQNSCKEYDEHVTNKNAPWGAFYSCLHSRISIQLVERGVGERRIVIWFAHRSCCSISVCCTKEKSKNIRCLSKKRGKVFQWETMCSVWFNQDHFPPPIDLCRNRKGLFRQSIEIKSWNLSSKQTVISNPICSLNRKHWPRRRQSPRMEQLSCSERWRSKWKINMPLNWIPADKYHRACPTAPSPGKRLQLQSLPITLLCSSGDVFHGALWASS